MNTIDLEALNIVVDKKPECSVEKYSVIGDYFNTNRVQTGQLQLQTFSQI